MNRRCFFLISWGMCFGLLAGCHFSHCQSAEEGVAGLIRIESATIEAEVLVNGRKVGRTPLNLPASYLRTTPLHITAVAVNHPEFRQELTIELPPIPEKIIVLNFDLPSLADKRQGEDEFDDQIRGKAGAGEEPKIIEKSIITEKYLLPPVVFFDTDRYDIKDHYLKKLSKFAAIMQKNQFDIEIIGYADERHNIAYNQILSLNRSLAVYDALKRLGLAEKRMQVEGRGKLYTIDVKGRRFKWEHDRRVEIQLKNISQ